MIIHWYLSTFVTIPLHLSIFPTSSSLYFFLLLLFFFFLFRWDTRFGKSTFSIIFARLITVLHIISKLVSNIFSISPWERNGRWELLAIYLIGPTSIANGDGRFNWCTNENGLKIYIDRDTVNGNGVNNWSPVFRLPHGARIINTL